MAELAIWMAGYTTVAIFPTETAETVATCSSTARPACCSSASSTAGRSSSPACRPACPASRLPLAPPTAFETWDADRRAHAAAAGRAAARRGRAGDDHLHLGLHRPAQGRDGQLRRHHARRRGRRRRPATSAWATCDDSRILSYLPLAHSFERSWVEAASLVDGKHARVLRRIAGHLLAGPAARTADDVHLGAAAVAQVPAGRVREDAAGQARPPARHPDPRPHRREEGAQGPGAGRRAARPAAARRRCRRS